MLRSDLHLVARHQQRAVTGLDGDDWHVCGHEHSLLAILEPELQRAACGATTRSTTIALTIVLAGSRIVGAPRGSTQALLTTPKQALSVAAR